MGWYEAGLELIHVERNLPTFVYQRPRLGPNTSLFPNHRGINNLVV